MTKISYEAKAKSMDLNLFFPETNKKEDEEEQTNKIH